MNLGLWQLTMGTSLTTLRIANRDGSTGMSAECSGNPSVQPLYACMNCGKQYKLRGSLRNHLRLECGKEPQFQCQLCDKKTHQKGNLLRHMILFHKQAKQF
ncbi:hypothetical protein R5R35_014201 [Gryllus longicercus]|uniref:C2H2-type domain-containing protein n=1 Tax=Gryllus longicercus TaxID=2509291 RepID=A0AAN9VVK3_9ORTH